jgi:hypothetical protein
MPKLSISTIIPVFAENILQIKMLSNALNSLQEQTLIPTEIILSDNSLNEECIYQIKQICKISNLSINYLTNHEHVGAAKNTNFAASHASSDLIHILYQDDFILNKNLYKEACRIFSENIDIWVIAQGRVEERILESKFDFATKFGFNELGGPSSLIVARKNFISFNPNYRMNFDVINYHEYFLTLGEPLIIRGVNIQFGIHEFQLSNKVKSKEVYHELLKFIQSYNITGIDIMTAVKSIKREVFHQRLLLIAGLVSRKISLKFFAVNFLISISRSVKRKIFN